MNKQYSEKEFWYFEQTERIEMFEFVDKSNVKKILDVGCSTGGFAKNLKEKFNCEAWGIEPFAEAFKIAEKHLDKTINLEVEDALGELNGEKFDHVFFIDVLEHLENPWEILSVVKNNLEKNGKVVASIPNLRYYPVILSLLRYNDFKYVQSGVMDKTHLRFFTRKSIIRMFEESGFTVLKITPINGVKYKVLRFLNILLLGRLWDMKYPQFAVVAEIKQ